MRHKTHAVHSSHPAVMKRLARAAGHIQGIIRMIEAKKSCPEVVQQMSAVIAAIESTRKVFLEDHIRGCILDAVRAKKPDAAFKELEHVLSLMS
jgi:DNA-binding FrmR family transcriptional regulator